MAVCLIFLMGVIWLAEKSTPVVRERVPVLASAAGILPAGFHFSPAQEPYREGHLYALATSSSSRGGPGTTG